MSPFYTSLLSSLTGLYKRRYIHIYTRYIFIYILLSLLLSSSFFYLSFLVVTQIRGSESRQGLLPPPYYGFFPRIFFRDQDFRPFLPLVGPHRNRADVYTLVRPRPSQQDKSDRSHVPGATQLERETISNRTYRRHKKPYTWYFYQQCSVLLTMVPRNSTGERVTLFEIMIWRANMGEYLFFGGGHRGF